MAENFTGWQRDPLGVHEYRYLSLDGKPTRLVSDGGKRGYDPPLTGIRTERPASAEHPEEILPLPPVSNPVHSAASEISSLDHGRVEVARTRTRTRTTPGRRGGGDCRPPAPRRSYAGRSRGVGANRSLASSSAPSLRLGAKLQRLQRRGTRRRRHCKRVST